MTIDDDDDDDDDKIITAHYIIITCFCTGVANNAILRGWVS